MQSIVNKIMNDYTVYYKACMKNVRQLYSVDTKHTNHSKTDGDPAELLVNAVSHC